MKTNQKLNRLNRLLKIAPRAVRYKLAGDDEALYTLVCDTFLELGGIYVKFLQGVLLQSSVMKSWRGDNKYKVFEAVPVDEVDIKKVLLSELKVNPQELFNSYELKPFATGSFGQVYHARLKGGQKVIIKVLRPQIKSILKFDLKVLGFIARVFTTDFTSFDVSAKKAIADFKSMTLRETDYIAEAAFAHEMEGVFINDPHIVIPKTYTEYCTSELIVQDYLDGLSVAEVLRESSINNVEAESIVKERCGSSLSWQLGHLTSEVLYGFFVHPRMPGDLHPGNVRLLPENKVGLIDFGISARKPKVPNVLYSFLKQLTNVSEDGSSAGDMFVGYIKYFSYDLYTAIKKIDQQFGSEEKSVFEIIGTYAQKIFDKATNSNFQVKDIEYTTMFGAFVNKTVNENNRFSITTKISEVELLRGIQTMVSLIDSLGQRKIIEQVFREVYERVTDELPQYIYEPPLKVSLHQALSTVDSWLSRLALKNPELFLQIKSFIAKGKLSS